MKMNISTSELQLQQQQQQQQQQQLIGWIEQRLQTVADEIKESVKKISEAEKRVNVDNNQLLSH